MVHRLFRQRSSTWALLWYGWSAWRLANLPASATHLVGSDKFVPVSDWKHVDDGYFDPFNFDWGMGLAPFNFSLALEQQRYQRSRKTSEMTTARRLDEWTVDEPRTCADDSCRCNSGFTDTDCGVHHTECPCCIRCKNEGNMRTCGETLAWGDVGILIEDKYYPKQGYIYGSCVNIDERVRRLDIFGRDKTFRDNELCRELAYQYICLFWGSSSKLANGDYMYKNRCAGGDDDYALFPCRSMCMRLAVACANNADYRQTCMNIPCCDDDECTEPIQGFHCTLGPARTGYVDTENLCDIYEFKEMTMDFYSSASTATHSIWIALVVAAIVPILFFKSASFP